MIIYYTHKYKNEKGESHTLLMKAAAGYLAYQSHGSKSIDECEDAAASLIRDIRTEGEFGKPYIPGFAPFSISHSMNTWAVLLPDSYVPGNSIPCGLDIQYARSADAAAVAGRFFAAEDAKLTADAGSDTEDVFFRIWTRREALVKAIGTSVAESGLPAVSGRTAEYRGAQYRIDDIIIPGADRLYAAVCFAVGAPDDREPVYTELDTE